MILIGEKVKDLRAARKLSQKELAQILQVTPAAICNMELNSRQPSLAMLLKLSNVFHVSVDYLLGNEPSLDTIKTQGLTRTQVQIINNLIQTFLRENSNDNVDIHIQ